MKNVVSDETRKEAIHTIKKEFEQIANHYHGHSLNTLHLSKDFKSHSKNISRH
ncbi:hypothetical protein KHA80_14575 [Anaerobacillus sp. HL2]|nr:hypothetical protein KHA80_14575 [Anaerobacillus sp. HL2]